MASRQPTAPRAATRAAAQAARLPAGEIKAVQVEREMHIKTGDGEYLARPGQWLVTEADGTQRLVSDRAFRLQFLHNELLQMILRSKQRLRKRA